MKNKIGVRIGKKAFNMLSVILIELTERTLLTDGCCCCCSSKSIVIQLLLCIYFEDVRSQHGVCPEGFWGKDSGVAGAAEEVVGVVGGEAAVRAFVLYFWVKAVFVGLEVIAET